MSELLSQIDETRRLTNTQFRKWVIENEVSKFYHPYVHIVWNIGVLFTLMVIAGSMIETWNLPVFAVYAFAMLLGNFVVWAVHRYPLHRRYKISPYTYERHTVMHHRYFTQDFITYDGPVDFYAVFFPMRIILGFALVVMPGFYLTFNFLFGKDMGLALASGASGYFLLYEFTHWASHLSANHPLIKIPWLRYMRNHHIVHHNPKLMMKYNFTIVYPLMDILLGTKYRAPDLPKDDQEDHYTDVKANSPRP